MNQKLGWGNPWVEEPMPWGISVTAMCHCGVAFYFLFIFYISPKYVMGCKTVGIRFKKKSAWLEYIIPDFIPVHRPKKGGGQTRREEHFWSLFVLLTWTPKYNPTAHEGKRTPNGLIKSVAFIVKDSWDVVIFHLLVQTISKDVAEEKCGNLLKEVCVFPRSSTDWISTVANGFLVTSRSHITK